MMKRLSIAFLLVASFSLIMISCNTAQETDEAEKIENTLQSVSYFQDTVGLDPLLLKEIITALNEAIDEIGYPDAGYKLWVNQSEESDVKFMVEGLWPDQETYDIIHDNQLYLDAGEANRSKMDGLVRLEYHRFAKHK